MSKSRPKTKKTCAKGGLGVQSKKSRATAGVCNARVEKKMGKTFIKSGKVGGGGTYRDIFVATEGERVWVLEGVGKGGWYERRGVGPSRIGTRVERKN